MTEYVAVSQQNATAAPQDGNDIAEHGRILWDYNKHSVCIMSDPNAARRREILSETLERLGSPSLRQEARKVALANVAKWAAASDKSTETSSGTVVCVCSGDWG